MGDTPKSLGGRIRARREELKENGPGYEIVDIAKACGVTISAVMQWESGTTANIKLEPFFALCDYLKVHPRWLGIGQGEKDGIKAAREPLRRISVRERTQQAAHRKQGQKRS